ncbi:sialidase family protein [Namhaeicola litoreus]|uniref:Oxidoreductase n=1 Tax=Namhaeicola litoreus TaxID=1052145 RepID=A0ABW3Y359_9FLAO
MNKSIFLLYFIFVVNPLVFAQDKIVFQDFSIPSSIRAIEVINDSTLFFAGSNGIFGKVVNSNIILDSITNKDGSKPEFRAVTYNEKNVFILSIGNPAKLFKIDPFHPTMSPVLVYSEEHPHVFYDAMTFASEKIGYAMGDPTDDCLSFIKTEDGGHTWKKTDCNSLPKIIKGEAAFAASNTNIKAVKNFVWMVSGGKASRVFASHNYGINWKVVQSPIVQGKEMTGIYSCDFYDEKSGIIMGGNWENKSENTANKAVTKDSGDTWTLIANNNLPPYISCVRFVPNTNGKEIMAVSTMGIYKSGDGGEHWMKISDRPFYTIRFTNRTTAWLAGNKQISKITFHE